MGTCDSHEDGRAAREQLVELYTRLARAPDAEFGWGKGKENARALGYDEEWLNLLPNEVWESAAAVGNPFSLGAIEPGEVVVDFGCGAGADACIAGLLVSPRGSVVGIDCTPAMIEKATANARLAGLTHVSFQRAEITKVPLPDASVDVVISNGAINLAGDKEAVLTEAWRILKPNGRLQIADMIRDPDNTEQVCCGEESWANCVSGCLEPDVFISLLQDAGFQSVELVDYTGYKTAASTMGALIRARKSA